MALSPQESGEFIVQRAKYLAVKEEGVNKIKDVILQKLQNAENKRWEETLACRARVLCSAINRAISEDFDITNPNFYANITLEQLTYILRPDDGFAQLPMLKERLAFLNENGKKLVEKYGGKFKNCVKPCNHSAQKLLRLIVEEFPCFKDES